MDASLSDTEIIEKLMLSESSWWKSKGRNILSIIMLFLVVIALLCFEFSILLDNISFPLTIPYSIPVILLLLINAYYGFRD